MPRIPTYTSKVTPTTEPPRVYIKPAKYAEEQSPELAAKTSWGASMEQAGKIVNVVAEKMLVIQNANANSEANILITKGMAEYEDEVNKRTDLNTAINDAPDRLDKLKKEGAKKFIDPRARAEWERNFDLSAIKYQNTLKANIDKRKVDLFRANTLREMDLESSNYINALTPQAKLASRQKISGIMDNAVQMRAFTNEQGLDEVNKVIKNADDSIKDLESLKKRKEKEIELAAKEAKNAREQELVEMRVNNKSSLNDLIIQARTDMNAGRIDAKFAEAYINSCTSPKPLNAKTDFDVYKDIMADIINPKKKATEIMTKILAANADGKLSDTDRDSLLFTGKLKQDPIFSKAVKEQKPGFLATAWNMITSIFKSNEDKATVMNNVIKRATSNPEQLPTITKEEIDKEIIKKSPDVSLAGKKGQLMIDAQGNKAIVYSDGSFEEVKE